MASLFTKQRLFNLLLCVAGFIATRFVEQWLDGPSNAQATSQAVTAALPVANSAPVSQATLVPQATLKRQQVSVRGPSRQAVPQRSVHVVTMPQYTPCGSQLPPASCH